MTIWATFTYVLLPPAIIILVLLTVPFPALISRGIVRVADLVFHLEIGTIRIFSAITFISFVVLCAQTMDLQKRYAVVASNTIEAGAMGYASDLQQKASRWRAERNWWIAALTFTIYWMSLRFHAVKRELNEALDRKQKKA